MQIQTRVSFDLITGAQNIFNTTDLDDLLNDLDLQDDAEGFPCRHLRIGTEFSIPGGEMAQEGRFRVVNISTHIFTAHQGDIPSGYHWNFQVVYILERI